MGRNFSSDNVTAVAPEIMAAMAAANAGALHSYGDDPHTERLTDIASAVFETPVAIYPVATGTAANALALSVLTPPYGVVYAHDTAHVATDECGAPEFYTGGAKVIGLPGADGKILPAQLDAPLRHAAAMGVHHMRPSALSITQATEWGTVYTPDEVRALCGAAHGHGLGVHMDGARFANAVAHLGCSPAEVTWKAGVDVLCLGATKNGAMAAEAVVFFDPAQVAGFERQRKRAGQLWSKLRFLSAQLAAYLEDGLWLRHAHHANAMAARLAAGLRRLPGVRLVQATQGNEVFAALPEPLVEALLAEGFEFYRWQPLPGMPGPAVIVRLVTAWCTGAADVDDLLAAAQRHHGGLVPSAAGSPC